MNALTQKLLQMTGLAWTAVALISSARAQDYASLAVVKPVISCAALAKTHLGKALGNVEPTIGLEVDLPVERRCLLNKQWY
jgi:hypothetical protein